MLAGATAKELGISIQTPHFYEQQGLILPSCKSAIKSSRKVAFCFAPNGSSSIPPDNNFKKLFENSKFLIFVIEDD